MFMGILPKKGPLFGEFLTQKPTHMGSTDPYPQHVMLPPGEMSWHRNNYTSVNSKSEDEVEREEHLVLWG